LELLYFTAKEAPRHLDIETWGGTHTKHKK